MADAGVDTATAYFTGAGYNMTYTNGRWYSFIGLPTWFTVGSYPVEVWSGEALLAAGNLYVDLGGFTFTDIELPPSSVDLLTDQARIDAEAALVESIEAGFTPEKYWSGPWVRPAEGVDSSNFGDSRSVNGGPYFPHTGQDIANEEGTPIYASAAGVVAMAQELYLYGNSVIIDHGVGVFSSYNHMQSSVVTPGQYVEQGQLIGYMGQTGFVSGPHVHWEAIIRNVRVDPRLFTYGAADP
jgi:murein DD-endopeptidase MepM/ murein hydrolase activator NlpD